MGSEMCIRDSDIIAEAKQMIEAGYKDITLLGQNVNSYGKGLDENITFSELLREIDKIPGEYRLRFMTSHPKDCTKELIDTIAQGEHLSTHIHLPFQSGSDRILKQMNRHYDREKYLENLEVSEGSTTFAAQTLEMIESVSKDNTQLSIGLRE